MEKLSGALCRGGRQDKTGIRQTQKFSQRRGKKDGCPFRSAGAGAEVRIAKCQSMRKAQKGSTNFTAYSSAYAGAASTQLNLVGLRLSGAPVSLDLGSPCAKGQRFNYRDTESAADDFWFHPNLKHRGLYNLRTFETHWVTCATIGRLRPNCVLARFHRRIGNPMSDIPSGFTHTFHPLLPESHP